LRGKETLLIMLLLITTANLANVPEKPPIVHAASPTVTITGIYNVTEPGKTFLVNITVSDVSNLFMWVINMSWDPSITQISTGDPAGLLRKGIRYNIYEGRFMKNIRSTVFVANIINNTAGTITSLSAGYLNPGTTPSGSGILATINFTLVKVGTTAINITGPSATYPGHSMLIDHTGKEMPHEDIDGVVTEHGPPPPPPIWTQLWFQVTVPVVVVAIAVGYVGIKVVKPARDRAKAKEAEEILEDEKVEEEFF